MTIGENCYGMDSIVFAHAKSTDKAAREMIEAEKRCLTMKRDFLAKRAEFHKQIRTLRSFSDGMGYLKSDVKTALELVSDALKEYQNEIAL